MNYMSLIAEFFGTFLLLMSIFVTGNALVIGLTLALVIFLIGDLSGGHVNPAVSLAMFLNGSLSSMELGSYVVVQALGGAAAYYVYKALA
jgi:aquaporin Z